MSQTVLKQCVKIDTEARLVKCGAEFSPCERYRYTLWRIWDETLPACMFIGLNPSTATEEVLDPTVKKCIKFAKRWECGALWMTNIFAWRDTDPRKMKKADEPIGGELTDQRLIEVAERCKVRVAAWGQHGKHLNRGNAVRRLISGLQCLKINSDYSPMHPLYVPDETNLISF